MESVAQYAAPPEARLEAGLVWSSEVENGEGRASKHVFGRCAVRKLRSAQGRLGKSGLVGGRFDRPNQPSYRLTRPDTRLVSSLLLLPPPSPFLPPSSLLPPPPSSSSWSRQTKPPAPRLAGLPPPQQAGVV